MSVASTAGWVMAVCFRSSSAWATAAASAGSTKMYSLRGRPRRGVITRSASSKVSRTTGSLLRRARSMLTYCEPWPVYRKASFGAGPLPRKIPCARSARQTAAFPPSKAASALPAFSARSAEFS